jgi:glycine/D-amino acid oxidase-like deaminating enzyme
MRLAVVGAGIHGASTARNLAERGHSVVLFDQFAPGHDRGSSHGRSRIVRRAYPDPFYTAIMKEGYGLWSELERASGRQLLHEVGLIYFGSEDSPVIASMAKGLGDLLVPHELLDAKGVRRVFPAYAIGAGEVGVYTPEAGWVDASAAVSATLDLARVAGCEFRQERVSLTDLEEFERVAVCPGAWVRDWWPPAPVKVTLQTVVYLRGDHGGPVWIEDGSDLMYGFPSDDTSFKVAAHRHGPDWDPASDSRTGCEQDIELARDLARRRFGIERPEVLETQGCLYTNTPTEDFLFKRLDERTVLVSACSGHGFKFGPWIGRTLADIVEGRTVQDFPRFAVD